MPQEESSSLEKEFYERKINHKSYIILEALSRPENQYLYSVNRILKDYENIEVTFIKGFENEFNYEQSKAYLVEADLAERAENGEDVYEKVYELCWKRVRQYQDEDTPEQYGLSK